jgi:hypothetical protein
MFCENLDVIKIDDVTRTQELLSHDILFQESSIDAVFDKSCITKTDGTNTEFKNKLDRLSWIVP